MNFCKILKLCRLCQSKTGIYCISQDDLTQKILECTRIRLDENHLCNSQPFKICEECKRTIDTFYQYLQIIYKVDLELRERIKQYESQNNDNETTTDKWHRCSKTCRKHKNLITEEETHLDVFNNDKDIDGLNDDNDQNKELLSTNYTNYNEKESTDYICQWESCNKRCTSAYSLKTHVMRHENKKPYLCVRCGKGFTTKNSLNCHEKIHLDIKAYICKLCNISFSVKSNLRAHERKHHEGVRFYCTQCTKAYISKSGLERHESLHTGIRNHRCDSCSSAFYTKKELAKHQIYHKGIRQHKCNQCFKTFFEKHHLTIHLRSHTGERPYACTIAGCKKAFTESQKLTRHLKSKHT